MIWRKVVVRAAVHDTIIYMNTAYLHYSNNTRSTRELYNLVLFVFQISIFGGTQTKAVDNLREVSQFVLKGGSEEHVRFQEFRDSLRD